MWLHCCCCRRSNAKANNVDDDSAEGSEPLITEAETHDEVDDAKRDENEERPGIMRIKSIGQSIDISDRSLSEIDGGVPELAHNPEVMRGRSVGDIHVRDSMMDSESITKKVPHVTKKVSFVE